jgi:hypothetical protein
MSPINCVYHNGELKAHLCPRWLQLVLSDWVLAIEA